MSKTIPITEHIRKTVNAYVGQDVIKKDEIGKELFQGLPGNEDVKYRLPDQPAAPEIGIKARGDVPMDPKLAQLRFLNANGKTYEMIECKSPEGKLTEFIDPNCPKEIQKRYMDKIISNEIARKYGRFTTKPEPFTKDAELAKILLEALFEGEIGSVDSKFVQDHKEKIEKLRKELFSETSGE